MDVPLNSTKISTTSRSYDDAYIQKIEKTTRAPPRTSKFLTLKLYDALETPSGNDIYQNLTLTDKRKKLDLDFWLKPRFPENGTFKFPAWNFSNLNFKPYRDLDDNPFAHIKFPRLEAPDFAPLRAPHTIWISSSSVIFIIIMVLRLCVYSQRCSKNVEYDSERRRLELEQQLEAGRPQPPEDTESINLSIVSDSSSQSPDLPPAYAECNPTNPTPTGVINKTLDVTTEDLPPPYSTCLTSVDKDDTHNINKTNIANTDVTLIEPQVRTDGSRGDTVINIDGK